MLSAGVHITCGYGGGSGKRGLTLPVVVNPVWSETMATPGTTTNVAPAGGQETGDPVFTIYCAKDCWISIGPNPDADASPRIYAVSGSNFNGGLFNGGLIVFGKPGDKVAWKLAT